MKFSEILLPLLKRIAAIDVAHASTQISDDGSGVLELTLLAIIGENIGAIAMINENSSEEEIAHFQQELDKLVNAVEDQRKQDEADEKRIHEILERMTPEERALIQRPLPEDLPAEDDGAEHF